MITLRSKSISTSMLYITVSACFTSVILNFAGIGFLMVRLRETFFRTMVANCFENRSIEVVISKYINTKSQIIILLVDVYAYLNRHSTCVHV